MRRFNFRATAAAALAFAVWAVPAQAQDESESARAPQAPVVMPARTAPMTRSHWLCEPIPDGCPCPKICVRDPLLRIPCLDNCVDQFQAAKEDSCLKIGVGGYNWFNLGTESGDLTYGYPNGGEGTYFYYINGDFACKTGSCSFPEVGVHAQARFRDDTNFRSWFSGPVWLYEGYAYFDTSRMGRVKVGAIWKRFGLDWDGTFWGNSQYYDGWKLDTDWGVSWERKWNEGRRVEMDSYVQLFFEENRVNGSLAGADPESSALYDEGLMGVVRVVPRWHFNSNSSIELGLSGIIGQIDASAGAPTGDDTLSGYAVDLTWKWCGLEVFAEYGQTWGTQNESHYVTGGPSDSYQNLIGGFKYTQGPFTLRLAYSHGEYENPGGEQDLLVAGFDVAVTNWLDFIVEYVDWDVTADGSPTSKFEDGWQFVFHWHF